MIVDSVSNLYKYLDSRKYQKISSYISNASNFSVGEYKIDEDVVVKVFNTHTHKFDSTKIESHMYHLDIQIPIECSERMRIYSQEGAISITEYDESKDVIFYQHTPPHCFADVLIRDSSFIMINPNEIHQCQIGDDEESVIKKIVIKVKV